jgi:AcrR family transcriptional regulator
VNDTHTPSGQARHYGLAIKQERSKVTYDALINAGFKLLEERDLQDISIAELAKEAGYSVGAFYARFRSKDEFFDALIAQHLDNRTATQIELFTKLPRDQLLNETLINIVDYYWLHRKFWRAVLLRSVRDPESYNPMRRHRQEATQRFIARLGQEADRKLSQVECTNVAFGFQVVLGTIDSTVINEPGPLLMDQAQFIEGLTRTFALVSEFDRLLTAGSE